MKLRYLVMLGVLVFLNGFVFTVLFLMFSREMASPAPTETATGVPTTQATFTSTPLGPTPTDTPQPTHTYTPEPMPTNTIVIVPPTVTHTNTPVPPTSTPLPPTATFTPDGPTETVPPPTATPTTPAASPSPTSTPETAYDFRYREGSMSVFGNCGGPYFKGVILGQGGVPTNGISVHFWFYDNHDCKVSGVDAATGEWGFNPGLADDLKNSHIEFYLQVVNSCTDLTPRSTVFPVVFDNACEAGQFENITFEYVGG